MRSIILGIDPGTTIGYAALDLEGNLIEVNSIKNAGLDKLIAIVAKLGKVVLVGTDVKKAPQFVNKFCAVMHVKLFVPEETMQFMQKKTATKDFIKEIGLRDKLKLKNKHEMDALAGAVSAFKHFKPLFNRIDQYLKSENKSHLKEKVKTVVLTENISMKKALAKL